MKLTLDRDPFSYKHDNSVPDFVAKDMVCVMDASCSLCARGASWIARNDKSHKFIIIPMQSEIGGALLNHYGLDPKDPTSWLFLDNGRAYSSLDAFIRVGQHLGGMWKGLSALRVLPTFMQDFLYRSVARNRYRLFGKTDMCSLPDAEVQRRLLQ